MSDVPRRRLSELAFIYDRDPDRRDIYVEGNFDASIINWFANECGLHGVAVYPIDGIEISDGDLIAGGQKTNNRERVVFLSTFLTAKAVRRAICVIDADFSRLRGIKPVKPPLYETDYACMEMYFFCRLSFNRFITICCQRNDWPVETIMESLASVLQEFFLYRCANDELEWNLDWLDRNACTNVDEWQINLNTEGFVTRLLNKNGRIKDKALFDSMVDTLRPNLKPDPRHQMNGHDLISLLTWFLRQKGISSTRAQAEHVRMCLTLTLDYQAMTQEPMFRQLLTHIT